MTFSIAALGSRSNAAWRAFGDRWSPAGAADVMFAQPAALSWLQAGSEEWDRVEHPSPNRLKQLVRSRRLLTRDDALAGAEGHIPA